MAPTIQRHFLHSVFKKDEKLIGQAPQGEQVPAPSQPQLIPDRPFPHSKNYGAGSFCGAVLGTVGK